MHRAQSYYAGLQRILVHNTGLSCRFRNQLPGELASKLGTARALGVSPIRAGGRGFDSLVNSGTIKWVVTESGELMVGPHSINGVEISHAVLSGGAPVRAAGQANIAATSGVRVGLDINNHSGHFRPSAESLQIGVDAFAALGVQF